ncbi:hypothetical protein C0989_008621 [Termitomyces sp. Mn162]|nr:hypothetical protein C0989_008621 [Termitomyces sp. Mn162]KAH0581148.1 hypothetical protein H2248_012274 [Termitomyces sp. 'cryptogamus']
MQTEIDMEENPVIYPTSPSPSLVTPSPKRLNNLIRFSESFLDQTQVQSQLAARSSFDQTCNASPSLTSPSIKSPLPVPAFVSRPLSVDDVSSFAFHRTSHRLSFKQPTTFISSPSRRSIQPTDQAAPMTSTRVLCTPALSPKKLQGGFDTWMVTNPYAETPRFSRLGITAPNVILPTSAREYKRVAAMKKAKLSPGRDLPLRRMRSLESSTTTETTRSSSETLPVSPSSTRPCSISLSDAETVLDGEEGTTKIITVEHSGLSHLRLKRCLDPSSIYIEGCSEDGVMIGCGKLSTTKPGPDTTTHRGVLSKFWKRLSGNRKERR